MRCFGYEPDGLTVRESEADEIKNLAKAVIDGKSLRSLAIDLNQRGIPTVMGKRWASSHLGRMLTRSRLAGLREHRGKVIAPPRGPKSSNPTPSTTSAGSSTTRLANQAAADDADPSRPR